MQTLINAIIYLPRHIPIDGMLAQQALAHIERRGYQLFSIVHEWRDALLLVRAGVASVIVFARPEHFEPDFDPRIEFVGETTADLTRQGAVIRNRNERDGGDGRHRRPRITT